MITQVYTAQTASEAVELASIGVDHIGVTVSHRGLPGEVGLQRGIEIVSALRDTGARCTALTVETNLDLIGEFVEQLRPDIVHLCGDTSIVGPEEVARLRSRWQRAGVDVEVMQAIGVIGQESIDLAIDYESVADWLILDSVAESVEGIGAAGITHDWGLSRQIVDLVDTPVVLAGGLGPDNVAAAIAAVSPAGVDSLTLTNNPNPDGSFVKDLDAVRRFVEAVGTAASQ